MKRMILIGKSGCGKTTLIQALKKESITYHKTQTIEFTMGFIDTPGEYIENQSMYRALIVHGADADVIGLVQDCTESGTRLPPGFASAFPKEVVGIVSKIDLAESEEQIMHAEDILRMSGVYSMFRVSALEDIGLEPLMEYLTEDEKALG